MVTPLWLVRRKTKALTAAARDGLGSMRGLEGQPAGVCRNGEGVCRCVYTGARVPMVACVFGMCGVHGVLREE